MSATYFVFYSKCFKSRNAVLDCISPIIRASGGKLLPTCWELVYDRALQSYRWTLEELGFKNIHEAIVKTEEWEGVDFAFEYKFGDLSAILWNDRHGETTLVLAENSALFASQNENEQYCKKFQKLFLSIAKKIDADFCILKCEGSLETISKDEIIEYLQSELFKNGEQVPILLIVSERLMPPNEIKKNIHSNCSSYFKDGYIVITDKEFGSARYE